ncbi:Fur family transcriptional regulator [Sulfuricurvum sp.]|uniref:Fur family transcriptional regulator n=1 Tax=Sulfuricurvum sp. TaxID=2025608 RepID=UPI003BB79206
MKHEQLLKHYHLKATPQRIAIIELMHQAGHISIDDLFLSIRQRFASISLATLYKNVHTMMNVSLIREVKIPGQKTKFEVEKEAHAHVMCKCCGELKDIPFDPNSLLQTSMEISNYLADEVSIVISGICPQCQKQ